MSLGMQRNKWLVIGRQGYIVDHKWMHSTGSTYLSKMQNGQRQAAKSALTLPPPPLLILHLFWRGARVAQNLLCSRCSAAFAYRSRRQNTVKTVNLLGQHNITTMGVQLSQQWCTKEFSHLFAKGVSPLETSGQFEKIGEVSGSFGSSGD